jgi:hypothetical protein
VGPLVQIVHGNALEADVSSATVVFLYLLPKGNARVAAKLAAQLRPGARVLTHMFRMPPAEWEARLVATRAPTKKKEEPPPEKKAEPVKKAKRGGAARVTTPIEI